MRESTKKSANFGRFVAIMLAVIVVLSVALWLVGQYGIGSEKLGFRAILILFACLFGLSGIFLTIVGIFKRSGSTLFFGGPSLMIGFIFLMKMFKVPNLAIVIISIAILVITFIAIYVFKAPQLIVETDNDPEAGHKTYAERQKEALDTKEKTEELPQLKTFKDE